MKITRRQLRDIILEAARTSAEGTTGARKVKGKNVDQLAVQTAARSVVEKALENVNHPSNLKGTVKVGRSIVSVDLDVVGSSEVREIESKIKAAVNALLPNAQAAEGVPLQDALKAFRRVKVDFSWTAETEDRAPETKPEETDGGGGDDGGGDDGGGGSDNCHDGKLYPYDNAYDYRVNSCTGCWEAKKKSGGRGWFSMRKYKSNMRKLDNKYPDARDKELRDKCDASASSGGGGGGNRPPNPVEILKTAFTEAEIRYAPEAGMPKVTIYQGTYRELKEFASVMEATLPSYLANAEDGQGFYLYHDIDNNQAYLVDVAAFRLTGSIPQFRIKKGFKVRVGSIDDKSIDPTRDATAFIKAVIDHSSGSSGGQQSGNQVSLANLSLGDKVEAKWSDGRFYPAEIDAINKEEKTVDVTWTEEGTTTKDIPVTDLRSAPRRQMEVKYGESRGTLLRKRYYGRY